MKWDWTPVFIICGQLTKQGIMEIRISIQSETPSCGDILTYRGYPAKRALSAMRKHGG